MRAGNNSVFLLVLHNLWCIYKILVHVCNIPWQLYNWCWEGGAFWQAALLKECESPCGDSGSRLFLGMCVPSYSSTNWQLACLASLFAIHTSGGHSHLHLVRAHTTMSDGHAHSTEKGWGVRYQLRAWWAVVIDIGSPGYKIDDLFCYCQPQIQGLCQLLPSLFVRKKTFC